MRPRSDKKSDEVAARGLKNDQKGKKTKRLRGSLLSAVIDNQSYEDHVELLADKDVSTCTRHQLKGITVKTFQPTFVT